MLSCLEITFLGTASAQPSSTRNHSALALKLSSDVWLFDCGEATQHQIQRSKGIRMGRIRKVFITHTHGDHIFGLAPLMASCMNGAGGTVDDVPDPRLLQVQPTAEPLEIYGPIGTRAYVRAALKHTHTRLEGQYVVHELRFSTDIAGDEEHFAPHTSELPGQNIPQVDGVWRDIFVDSLVTVSAGPIFHSVACVGYVVTELPVPGKIDISSYLPHIQRNAKAMVAQGIAKPMSVVARLQNGEVITLPDGTVLDPPARRPGRKCIILGDTYDPSSILSLVTSPPPDILIHEATNAYLPGVDPATKPEETAELVESRTKSRGHSTPQMAGAFASRIGAKMLVLNHFSARYPSDDEGNENARVVMGAIAALAKSEFEGEVICARDFMTIVVPRNQ